MRGQEPQHRPQSRRRFGSLLLLLGAAILLVPLGIFLMDEINYRIQMAQAPTPTPVILPATEPPSSVTSAPPGPAPTKTGPDQPEPQPAAPPATGEGDLTYQIQIPRIGIAYPVGEGIDDPVLAKGPGHYPQTVLPGEAGNAALAGHRTIRGRPAFFHDLDQLAEGDEIQISYGTRTLTFAVERVFLTSPYDLAVLSPTPYPSLTLTTCDPPGSDEMRLIVQSRLVSESPQP